MAARVTALVADDHPAMLAAVVDVLGEVGIEVIGSARDGQEALAKIEAQQPTVALVDMRMPRLSGIAVVRDGLRASPSTAFLLYTAYGDRALLIEALDAG